MSLYNVDMKCIYGMIDPAFLRVAKLQTIQFYIQFKRIPSATDLPNLILPEELPDWEYFLSLCGFPLIDHNRIKWKGIKGLKFATFVAKYFYKFHLRSPRTKDFENIYAAIYAGYWQTDRISSWNSFLEYCELPTNRGKKWQGKIGLELAINKYHKFTAQNGSVPNIIDLKSIFTKINEGLWTDYNIFSWNDFVYRSQQTISSL